MQEKTKTQADRQLIKKILGIDPVDWARYPDGTLVIITPAGKKFKYSVQMIDVLKDENVAAKRSSAKKASAKKSAAKKAKKDPLLKPYSHSDVAPGAAAK